MMNAFCMHCGQALELDAALAGSLITCPACGGEFTAPQPRVRVAVEAPPPPAAPAPGRSARTRVPLPPALGGGAPEAPAYDTPSPPPLAPAPQPPEMDLPALPTSAPAPRTFVGPPGVPRSALEDSTAASGWKATPRHVAASGSSSSPAAPSEAEVPVLPTSIPPARTFVGPPGVPRSALAQEAPAQAWQAAPGYGAPASHDTVPQEAPPALPTSAPVYQPEAAPEPAYEPVILRPAATPAGKPFESPSAPPVQPASPPPMPTRPQGWVQPGTHQPAGARRQTKLTLGQSAARVLAAFSGSFLIMLYFARAYPEVLGREIPDTTVESMKTWPGALELALQCAILFTVASFVITLFWSLVLLMTKRPFVSNMARGIFAGSLLLPVGIFVINLITRAVNLLGNLFG